MTYKNSIMVPHVEYPCLACNYICDNPSQILHHYEKRHNIDLELKAENVHAEAFEPQYGCPFCPYCCERDVDLILVHYEEAHELYLRLEGEDVVEDKRAKIEATIKKKAPSTSKAKFHLAAAAAADDNDDDDEEQDMQDQEQEAHYSKNRSKSPPRVIDRQHYRISGEILRKMYELTELMKTVFYNHQ
ncbi:hypothetical protein BDF20DRAFT_292671 [Mycotypha africana]|uniref:uncharacterized protein n=1 Tax=Mycotypha africana TaxID=64632 RepID=UPI002300FA33|nr:uncharacterized protein BDF20DRAFT_292671 [Mycotypha africana]KAI8987856.1 hypothetical protein BDF20DRAFT_292671 [Mycotypha africana]